MIPRLPRRRDPSLARSASSFFHPLLSGVILGLSFPPYPFSMLAWGALVPLLLRWTRLRSAGRMLAEAYAGFGVACAVTFYWVLLHDISEAALASLGGLLLIPLLMALPFAASVPLRRYWGPVAGFAALNAFYLSMEWSLSHGPFAFPWPVLGHTQATFDPFRQIADLAGVPGVTAWVLAINGCILAIIRAERPFTRGAVALAGLFLIGGAGWYGTERLETPAPASTTTRALLVQPSLPPSAWSDVTQSARIDTLLYLSTVALDTTARPVQLIVWPETALPALPHIASQRALFDHLQRWTARHDVALLTGAVEPAVTPRAERGAYFNSAFLLRPDTLQRYRKNYLVPFAEHVPFSSFFPRLQSLSVPAGGVAGYHRGTHQPTLYGPTFRTGALICFESTFSHHVRAYVESERSAPGVDFLVTLAQDGWWGDSPGYRQHLAFSLLRAIEIRRAMAFVTVSGTTTLIDRRGHALAPTGWMEQTVRRVAIPHGSGQTLYVRYGHWLSPLALALALGFGLVGLVQSFVRRSKRRNGPPYS